MLTLYCVEILNHTKVANKTLSTLRQNKCNACGKMFVAFQNYVIFKLTNSLTPNSLSSLLASLIPFLPHADTTSHSL